MQTTRSLPGRLTGGACLAQPLKPPAALGPPCAERSCPLHRHRRASVCLSSRQDAARRAKGYEARLPDSALSSLHSLTRPAGGRRTTERAGATACDLRAASPRSSSTAPPPARLSPPTASNDLIRPASAPASSDSPASSRGRSSCATRRTLRRWRTCPTRRATRWRSRSPQPPPT